MELAQRRAKVKYRKPRPPWWRKRLIVTLIWVGFTIWNVHDLMTGTDIAMNVALTGLSSTNVVLGYRHLTLQQDNLKESWAEPEELGMMVFNVLCWIAAVVFLLTELLGG